MKLSNVEDIELARRLLEQENLNLVVVKGGQTLTTSNEEGIYPLFKAIASMGGCLHGAAVADKIVGVAVAMLCLYAQIASVYADIASKEAVVVLREQGVTITSKNMVFSLGFSKPYDLCPFEKLAQRCRQPSQLFSALQSFFAEGE